MAPESTDSPVGAPATWTSEYQDYSVSGNFNTVSNRFATESSDEYVDSHIACDEDVDSHTPCD